MEGVKTLKGQSTSRRVKTSKAKEKSTVRTRLHKVPPHKSKEIESPFHGTREAEGPSRGAREA